MLLVDYLSGKYRRSLMHSMLFIIVLGLMVFGTAFADSHIKEISDTPINVSNISLETSLNLTQYKGLLIQDSAPWDSDTNSIALNNLGIQYDTIGSNSLSTTDLSNYKFIMYASDQTTTYYQNIAASINKIEDFVAHGGFLIAHCCDQGWAGGEWSGFKILPGAGVVGHINDYRQDQHIVRSNNPIVSELWDPMLYNWFYSTHGYFTNLPQGASVVMTTGGNLPTYIDYKFGLGRVIATMQTVEWGYTRRGITQLLNNEIKYATSGIEPKIYDLKVSGGISKYEGKYSGTTFRRGENKPKFEVTSTLSSGDKLMIDIYKNGNLLTTLPAIDNVVEGKSTTFWSWTSNTWSRIPDDIEVGTYKAKARIVSKKGIELSISNEIEFYVIFDYNIGDFFVESNNNYAVNFDKKSGTYNYPLDQYNENIFGNAISIVDGQTNLQEASTLISQYASHHPHACVGKDDCEGSPACRHYAWAVIEDCRAVGIPARFLWAIGDFHDGGRMWNGEWDTKFNHAFTEVKNRNNEWIHYDPDWEDNNQFGCDEYAKVGAEFRPDASGYWVSAPTKITDSGSNEQPANVYDRYTFCSDATNIAFLNPPYDYGKTMQFEVTVKNEGAIPIGTHVYVRVFDVPSKLLGLIEHQVADIKLADNLDAGSSITQQFSYILPDYGILNSFYKSIGDRCVKAVVYYKADDNGEVVTSSLSERIPGLGIGSMQSIVIEGKEQRLTNASFISLDRTMERSLIKETYILKNNATFEVKSESAGIGNYLKSVISIENPSETKQSYTYFTQLLGLGNVVFIPSVGNVSTNTTSLNVSTKYFITYNNSTGTNENVSIHEFSANMTIKSICMREFGGISGVLMNVTYDKELDRESSHDLMMYLSNREGNGLSFSKIHAGFATEIVDKGDSLVDMDISALVNNKVGDFVPINVKLRNNGVEKESLTVGVNVTKIIDNIPPTTLVLYDNTSRALVSPGIEDVVTFLVPTNQSTKSGYWNIVTENNKSIKSKGSVLIDDAFDLNITRNEIVSRYSQLPVNISINNTWDVTVHGVTAEIALGNFFSTGDSNEILVGDLLPHQNITLQWQLNASSLGNLPIEVQVTSSDGGYDSISSSIIVLSQPVLWIPSVTESAFNAGGQNGLPVDIKIYNIGDLKSNNVSVNLVLPTGANATENIWFLDELPGNSNATLHTSVTWDAEDDFIINVYAFDDSGNSASSAIYIDIPSALYYPDFTDTANADSWRSWLVLQNPSNSTANITLDLRSRSGSLLYTGGSEIPAHGVSAISPRDLVGTDCAGSAIIRSDQQIIGTCQITRNSNEMCMGYNALDHGSTTLYYPDFTDTAGPNSWRSWLILQNPTSSPVNLSLDIKSRTGSVLYSGNLTISPYAVNAIRPRNLAGADCAGSVLITSDLPITGTCQITRNSNKMCMSYNALDHGSATLYYPDFTDTADPNSWRSLLVLQNPWVYPANLTYEIRSRAGDILYTGNDTIIPYGVSAIGPRNLIGSDCSGSVIITSDLPIMGSCQITRNSNEMCMSYNALDQGSTALYYADFTDTANPYSWRSLLAIQNPTVSAANITLEIRSRAGDLLYSGAQVIPAYGVNAIRPRNLAGSDCSGSVMVSSDQPIMGTCQITRNDNSKSMSYSAAFG
jgi:hypothetical protein